MLMRQYLYNNGEHVTLLPIEKPDREYKTAEDPLRFALEHEKYVTGLINAIYAAADAVHDYRTMQCFDWFVKEQGEEEIAGHVGFRWLGGARDFIPIPAIRLAG